MGRALPTDGRHVTYQCQPRKCGKPGCKICCNGKGHGPYWYGFWRENGRLVSAYVGRVRADAESVVG